MPRKPTNRKVPVVLNKLHGNPSRRKISPETPEGVGVLWAAPAHFNDEQRALWIAAIESAPAGLLTETDRGCLTIWCVAAALHIKATRQVVELGELVKTKDGNLIQNPYLPIVNRQALIMLKAGAEMGFTPSSRASIGAQLGAMLDGKTPSGFARGSSELADFIEASPDVSTSRH